MTVDTPTRTPPEREILCVSLKKDPKLGFGEFTEWHLDVNLMQNEWAECHVSDSLTAGLCPHFLSGPVSGFVIVGEDNTGKLDLGIFIASIVPDGPADKDGRIKPGTKHQQRKLETRCRTVQQCNMGFRRPNKDHRSVTWCWFSPGGRLISLNKTSLEGVTFSDAAAILQNSPDEVELIVSQPKRKIHPLPTFFTNDS